MNKERALKLAKVVSRKQQIVARLGMTNIVGLSPEERVDLDAQHRVALDDLAAAKAEYIKAIDGYAQSCFRAPFHP